MQTIKVAHFRLTFRRQMFVVAYPRETYEMAFDAIGLHSPIAPGTPVHEDLRGLDAKAWPIVCIDDLLVRRNLPRAIQTVIGSAR